LGKDRIFPETEDIIEAYMHLPDDVVTEFKLLVYTGCRFSHGYDIFSITAIRILEAGTAGKGARFKLPR